MKRFMICLLAALFLTGCAAATEKELLSETVPASVVPSEEAESFVYVSMGDSIARGYGLSNIHEERFSTIAGQNWGIDPANVFNYGVDGQTSWELIAMLQNGGAAMLAEADVVSISIGANNVLRHAFQFLYDYYLYLYADPPQYSDEDIAEMFRIFTESADLGCEILAEDIPVLLETIRDINPDCQILFLTLYNPYAAVNTELHIDGLPIQFAALSDSYVTKINDCILEGTADAENLTIVDVYSAFDGRTAELVYAATPADQNPADLDLNQMDPHPNSKGHRLIGRLVSDAYTIE